MRGALSIFVRLAVGLTPLVACGGDDGAHAPPLLRVGVRVIDEQTGAGVPGAEVSFDLPAGARQQRSTDADGRAAFEVRGTADARAAVTAVSADHLVVSALEVPLGSEVVLQAPLLDAKLLAGTVELRGTFAGKRDESVIDVSVSGLARRGTALTRTNAFALRVPRGRPFVLVGHELLGGAEGAHIGSFRLDLPAREADATENIDLATVPKLGTGPLRAGVVLPPGFVGGDGALCSAIVTTAESQLLVGAFRAATTAAERCDVEMVLARDAITATGETAVTIATAVAADGSRTIATEEGVVAEGTTLDGLLTPPRITDVSRALVDPIVLEGLAPGARVEVDVFGNDQRIWRLVANAGLAGGTLRIPVAPIAFSADLTLVALQIGVSEGTRTLPSGVVIHRREARSRDVIVRR